MFILSDLPSSFCRAHPIFHFNSPKSHLARVPGTAKFDFLAEASVIGFPKKFTTPKGAVLSFSEKDLTLRLVVSLKFAIFLGLRLDNQAN